MQQTMYAGLANSPQTEISAGIDAVQNTVPLLVSSRVPDAPNLVTIGTDETAETILYTGKAGNTLTGVMRGVEGAAIAWGVGSKVARNFTAKDYESLRQNIADHENRISDAENDKSPNESPEFTGTPTAPTAAVGTNSTQIATTEFVQNTYTASDVLAKL
ncbi:hypothetical protein SD71_16255 [Cohnella kolymensis]|uniref:Uncharacterized protein n=1 Tax=Cohnella kolymensis TaxID=1590652 RepID=A0ABR5A2B0_9BACL|nr:hypothetical protein [Cohnella kolymensis]KIL35175.1 hypothetical protein SD71_16255 [Cohnella kolymensis]